MTLHFYFLQGTLSNYPDITTEEYYKNIPAQFQCSPFPIAIPATLDSDKKFNTAFQKTLLPTQEFNSTKNIILFHFSKKCHQYMIQFIRE